MIAYCRHACAGSSTFAGITTLWVCVCVWQFNWTNKPQLPFMYMDTLAVFSCASISSLCKLFGAYSSNGQRAETFPDLYPHCGHSDWEYVHICVPMWMVLNMTITAEDGSNRLIECVVCSVLRTASSQIRRDLWRRIVLIRNSEGKYCGWHEPADRWSLGGLLRRVLVLVSGADNPLCSQSNALWGVFLFVRPTLTVYPYYLRSIF